MAQTFNYQGQFYNEAGSAVLLDTVNLTLEILDPTGACLLYSEQQNGIDLSTTNGLFAVQVGSLTTGPEAAKRTVAPAPVANRDPVPGLSMATIFSNLVPIFAPGTTNCGAGYDPSSAGHAGDGRLLRVIVDDVTTSTTVTLSPDLPIGSAGQTMSSQTLQGIGPTGFIQVDSVTTTGVTQAHMDLLTAGPTTDASSLHNHDSLYVKLSSGTSQSLGSGVTFTTAGQIGIGTSTPGGNLEIDAESAGAIAEIIKPHAGQTGDLLDIYNTGGTIETKINSSGDLVLNGSPAASQSYVTTNFLPLAGGALTGPVTSTSTITFLNGTKSVGFAPPTTAPAANVTWALPNADGSVNSFLQTDGAGHLTWAAAAAGGITSLDGLSGSAQTFATTEAASSTAPAFTAATTVHTLNIPMASAVGTTAGLIANTDYTNFSGKVNRGGDTMTGALVINTPTSAPSSTPQETISTHAAGDVGLVVQGSTAQIANLFETQLSSGTRETYIDPTGKLFLNVDPTSNMQAATQEYVTTAVSTAGGNYLPLIGGALAGPGNLSVGGTLGVTGVSTFTGNVGVGTTTPNNPLTVVGTTDPLVYISQNEAATSWMHGERVIAPNMASGDNLTYELGQGLTAGNGAFMAFSYSGNNSASNALNFGFLGNSTVLSVTNGGDVGIGTTSPGGTFDVEGGTATGSSNGSNIILTAQNAGTGGSPANGGNIILMPGSNAGSGTYGAVGVGNSSPAGALLSVGSGGAGSVFGATITGQPGAPATSGSTPVNGSLRLSANTTDSQVLDMGIFSTSGSWIQASNGGSLAATSPLALNPNGGAVGIRTATPSTSSELTLGAGTSTVAPMIILPGTNLSTAVSGAIENDGTNLYYTNSGGTRYTLSTVGGSGTLSGLSSGDILIASGTSSVSTGGNLAYSTSNYGMTLNATNAPTGDALQIANAPATSSTNALLSLGASNIASGSSHGTYIGVNAASGYAGDLVNLEVNGTSVFDVSSSGFLVTTSGIESPNLQLNGYSATPYTGTGATAYPGANTLYVSNNAYVDGTIASTLLNVTNSSSVHQDAYIGAVSNTGAGYSPSIVFGEQTGAATYGERMRIDGSGNVGIGTTTPAYPLSVQYSNATDSAGVNSTNSNAGGFSRIQATNDAGNSVFMHIGGSTSTAPNVSLIGGYGTTGIQSDATVASGGSDPLFFGAGGYNNTWMSILPSGNVGIGTTTPTALLNIVGADATMLTQATNAADYSGLNMIDNSGTLSASFQYGNPSASFYADQFFIGARKSTTPIVFSTYAAGDKERMRILPNGNVGIGTTSPVVSLDVNGGIRAGSTTAVTTCGSGSANGEGTQRYNYTTHNMEYCNGSSWTALGSGGSTAMTLVATLTASSSSTFTWTGLAGNNYQIMCAGLVPANNGDLLYLEMGEGAGPTWRTASYYWANTSTSTSTGTAVTANGFSSSQIAITPSVQISGGGIQNAVINLTGLSQSITHGVNYQSVLVSTATPSYASSGSGLYLGDSSPITAVKVYFASGNITSGTCSLYAITN